jgi:phosphoenolpyruvate carboxylase
MNSAKDLTAKECLGIGRCISTTLSLINSAEVQHRLWAIKRHEQEHLVNDIPGTLYHTEDSIKGSIQVILQSKQATEDDFFHQLCTQSVELVLTAHPTVLRKYCKCTEFLAHLERPDLLPIGKLTATSDFQRIISGLWCMDEIRRNKTDGST